MTLSTSTCTASTYTPSTSCAMRRSSKRPRSSTPSPSTASPTKRSRTSGASSTSSTPNVSTPQASTPPTSTPPASTPASTPSFAALAADARIASAVASSFAAPPHPSPSSSTSSPRAEDVLVAMVTRDLEDLCNANEPCAVGGVGGAGVADKLKMFYSAFKQPFDLEFYVRRLVQYTNCSSSAFIIALVYLDRLQQNEPTVRLNFMNCHRLLMTALVLATKYLDDELYANAYYARVGGLSIEELNRLESTMLGLLKWRLAVTPEVFSEYDESLLMAIGGSDEGGDVGVDVVPVQEPLFAE